MGHCTKCDLVFELAQATTREIPQTFAAAPVQALLPDGYTVTREPGRLEIIVPWNRLVGGIFAVFSVVWFSFLAMWFTLGNGGLVMLMLMFHVLAGVAIAYTAAANLINTTTITVTDRQLRVEHAPLPWTPTDPIPVSLLEQLYVAEHRQKTKNGVNITYDVIAKKGSADRPLVRGLDNVAHARFLEQVIEQHLGIEDRRMPGEHPH